MNVLDLFSGIGGFSLGLERAGMDTVAFCEMDPFCQRVLDKHWPGVPIHDDIRELDGEQYRGTVDVVCGGFPCQDVSSAGARAGIRGERSGLWKEYARIVREVRPKYVIVENVSGLLARGMGEVLGDLAELGFAAEWESIPAASVGAPHVRDRVWIVAHAGRGPSEILRFAEPRRVESESGRFPDRRGFVWKFPNLSKSCDGWEGEPAMGRVANGIPNRVDRLRALGNAVVPQIPEIIGRAILATQA